jgi:hypothetical protein
MKKILALLAATSMLLSGTVLTASAEDSYLNFDFSKNQVSEINPETGVMRVSFMCSYVNTYIKENDIAAKFAPLSSLKYENKYSYTFEYDASHPEIPDLLYTFMKEKDANFDCEQVEMVAVDRDPRIPEPPISDIELIRSQLTDYLESKGKYAGEWVVPKEEMPADVADSLIYVKYYNIYEKTSFLTYNYEDPKGLPQEVYHFLKANNMDMSLVKAEAVDPPVIENEITDAETIKDIISAYVSDLGFYADVHTLSPDPETGLYETDDPGVKVCITLYGKDYEKYGDAILDYAESKGIAYYSLGFDSMEGISDTDLLIYGDVNGNGTVDVADVIFLNKASTSSAVLTADQVSRADVNNDGIADALDAALIMQMLIKL